MASYIAYNGVQMSLVQTRRYLCEPIRLAQDTAGQRHTATFVCTVALRTIGGNGGNAGPFPIINLGLPNADSGLQAFLTVRDRLLQLRRPLNIVVGRQVVANQPPTNTRTDIEWGPHPLACNLVQINAEGSLTVEYTIQWAEPACPGKANQQAVLAHAWQSLDDLDEQYFITRTYTGKVHFNPHVIGGAAGVAGDNPDQIRGLLLPPRTPGTYRRLTAQLSEDCYSMTYRVVDRQPQAFCNSFEVVKIEASQTMRNIDPSIMEQLAGSSTMVGGLRNLNARGVGGAAREAMNRTGRGSFFGNVAELGGQILNSAGGILAFLSGNYMGIPTTIHTFEAIAYGNPASRYSELARAARLVCLFRLMRGTLTGQLGLAPYGAFCEQQDRADPKTSRVLMAITTRPAGMAEPNGRIWELGENTMPTIVNRAQPAAAAMQNRPIVAADNQAIPESVRQLVYGATIRQKGDEWGWFSTAFAPDMLSDLDAEVRETGPAPVLLLLPAGHGITNGILNRASLIANTLVQAIQDTCEYKTPAAFTTTKPLKKLP